MGGGGRHRVASDPGGGEVKPGWECSGSAAGEPMAEGPGGEAYIESRGIGPTAPLTPRPTCCTAATKVYVKSPAEGSASSVKRYRENLRACSSPESPLPTWGLGKTCGSFAWKCGGKHRVNPQWPILHAGNLSVSSPKNSNSSRQKIYSEILNQFRIRKTLPISKQTHSKMLQPQFQYFRTGRVSPLIPQRSPKIKIPEDS